MQSDDFSEMPIVISCKIADAGITIMKVHIDNGSNVDMVYEQCFIQLPESIKANLQPTAVSLTGFAGESSLPIGILPLDIELADVNDEAFARKARIATICPMSIIPICAAVNVKSVGQGITDDADNMEIINPAYPEEKIKVGRNVSEGTRKQIVQLLVQYMDVFAWCENDMTGVPRHIAEHRLNVNPALKPVVQKRRGMAPDRVKWLCDEVIKLVRAGILHEVQYQSWIANPVLVKKPDEQGIQANPKKIVAIENMTAPRTVKEQKSFVWSSKAETAFQEMKKLLKTLPTLIAPVDGEILYLYISVANEAFGSALIAERNKIQKPVLRRYFQGHPVHVLTNLPIKQVLTKPEISGRLAFWAVELGAYQISYLPRRTVKGQVMADYLAEMSGELEVVNERTSLKPVLGETWDLFTDGASCVESAEYEALLAGLNIARKMNITKLRAFTDSQLVANQFNGSFEAHDPSMQKYLHLLKEMAAQFEHFELAQVPRSQNKKADALSKLDALTFSHFQKQVWVEELPSKSVDSDLMVASVTEAHPNWMEPIMQYIRNDILPGDSRKARLVRERAPMYIIQNDILYRKSYCGPTMRCVGPIEAEMIVEEVHNVTLSIGISAKFACAVPAASRALASEQTRSPMAGGSGSGMVQCGAISSRNSTLSRSRKAAA
ncbi:uncharacterized protein [Rutidosis leptorrhynchoides]|uniref:uncharacterized protein n=1 Tax=Rutidosis leptorrhynchoides TaxID=125765 RepID=UPI003A99E4C7